jgi:hypothetical protein
MIVSRSAMPQVAMAAEVRNGCLELAAFPQDRRSHCALRHELTLVALDAIHELLLDRSRFLVEREVSGPERVNGDEQDRVLGQSRPRGQQARARMSADGLRA